ncbi:MAG: pyridoxal-phosphate dependent enzyme [Candidatus Bathyarchaeia archaeon]|jgi:tryptophan synthase beta chain
MTQDVFDLSSDEIPKKWYNIIPDLPNRFPSYRDDETGNEIRRLPETFTKAASELEFSTERWIDIPDDVISNYIHRGRPTPLIRARRLETHLNTLAKIFYKCEDLPPGGTFKLNTAIPQAYWAMKEGFSRTIIGGSAATRTKFLHASAANTFGLVPTIIMTREECLRNKEQVFFLKRMFEADLIESPSNQTEVGRKFLKENPHHPGSASIRDQEIAEIAKRSEDTIAVMSSFLNHILTTQTIIGLEAERQLELANEKPDILVTSVGSGSHFFGLIAPFMKRHLSNELKDVRFLAVEAEASSKLTNGVYDYTTRQGPLSGVSVKAYKLEWKTHPAPISGMGIQTRNTAPLLSFLRHKGLIETRVYPNDERSIREAASIFLRTEGRLLAPESAYAIRGVIDEALEAKKRNQTPVIVVSISGATYLDFEEKRIYARIE